MTTTSRELDGRRCGVEWSGRPSSLKGGPTPRGVGPPTPFRGDVDSRRCRKRGDTNRRGSLMRKFISTPRGLFLGITAVAVVLCGAGVASGTIGASKPNVYWACVPKDGRITLVNPGSTCKKGERL